MRTVAGLPGRGWRWLSLRWEWRWLLRVVGVVGALALVAAALVLPSLLIGPDAITDAADRAKARADLRTAAVQGLGVLAVLLAGWYTARTYRLGREGQLTERFKAGVELLSGEDVSPAGGMLALERVARDSRRDHPVVIELLAIYARVHASSQEDLRAALLIIGRRELRYDPLDPLTIDLTELKADGMKLAGLTLDGADLSRGHLEAAVLTGLVARRSRLEGMHLKDAELQGACLDESDLTRADLRFAFLAQAQLHHTQLPGADLTGAMLLNADFSHAVLPRAILAEAQLHATCFVSADLRGADLRNCSCALTLEPPNFSSADLTSVDGWNVDGRGAVLPRANFRGADLRGARFDDATLFEADFRGASVEGASFQRANLTDSRRDGSIGLPDVTDAVGIDGW